MGEFTDVPKSLIKEPEVPENGYSTDVQDVNSDSIVKHGNVDLPCFNVSSHEFHQNMQSGRRRLRFKNGSNAQKYMSGTKYSRPFYISHTDANGKTFQRKIK